MSSPYQTDQEFLAYLDGLEEGGNLSRIAAFGAIRRAAAVARECEATGWEQTTVGLQWAWWNKAQEIRRAIRAAIGSSKV